MATVEQPSTQADGGAFRGCLQPHQAVARDFLLRTPRALLADETGLGKTIEALALLGALHDRRQLTGKGCRVLWMTEASLIEQARQEAARFLPSLTVLYFDDPQMTRPTKRLAYHRANPQGPDIVLVSYDMASSRLGGLERLYQPSVVVLDEVMALKGHGKHHAAVKALTRTPGVRRVIAMTATPYGNHPMETHAVLELVNPPGLLPAPRFQAQYVETEWDSYTRTWKPLGWKEGPLDEFREWFYTFTLRSVESYSPSRERQRMGRLCRIGSPHTSYEHLVLAPLTPDETKRQAILARKERDARKLLENPPTPVCALPNDLAVAGSR